MEKNKKIEIYKVVSVIISLLNFFSEEYVSFETLIFEYFVLSVIKLLLF